MIEARSINDKIADVKIVGDAADILAEFGTITEEVFKVASRVSDSDAHAIGLIQLIVNEAYRLYKKGEQNEQDNERDTAGKLHNDADRQAEEADTVGTDTANDGSPDSI